MTLVIISFVITTQIVRSLYSYRSFARCLSLFNSIFATSLRNLTSLLSAWQFWSYPNNNFDGVDLVALYLILLITYCMMDNWLGQLFCSSNSFLSDDFKNRLTFSTRPFAQGAATVINLCLISLACTKSANSREAKAVPLSVTISCGKPKCWKTFWNCLFL